MSHEPSPWPAFSWSHSRDRTLVECTRAYYWRFYGSHNGWQSSADPEVRFAHALKHLTTLPMVLGTAVHECARHSALATRQRTPRPTFDVMLARVSDALNRAVLGSHHRARFLRDPKRHPMLHDVWYTGRHDGAALVQAVGKVRTCLRALEETAVWSDLEACRPEWLTVVDKPGGVRARGVAGLRGTGRGVSPAWPAGGDPGLEDWRRPMSSSRSQSTRCTAARRWGCASATESGSGGW